MRTLTLVVVLLLLPVLGAAGGARADNPVLTGNVGANDAFTISLADPAGAPVRHLDPGTYTLLVHDSSTFHNFHLTGPGVDVSTPVELSGDFTFTITITDGTYKFMCDPHATIMKGSFTAGTVTTTTTTTPTPAPTPAATKLLAAVGPGAKISLRAADGSALSSLSAGSFSIVVRDRSATDDFHLAGPGVSKATGVSFKGTVTWKLKLKAGRYTFRSDKHAKLHGAFTLSS